MDSARAALRSVAADHRDIADVGRHARLELTFGCRGDRTVLLHSYAEPPFRVGRVLQDGTGVHLILASSAPGIFGGDCLTQTIVVESGARVRLTSQSATQVHAHEGGAPAILSANYRVEHGGHLSCEWDPVIPFADAQLEQRIAIELAEGASLFWSDALMGGREARGERWRFSRLVHELRLIRAGTLAYLERYRITPHDGRLSHRWIANESCYFGTVLAVGEKVNREGAVRLHHELAGLEHINASADILFDSLMLVRLASALGTSFHAARAMAGWAPFFSGTTRSPTLPATAGRDNEG